LEVGVVGEDEEEELEEVEEEEEEEEEEEAEEGEGADEGLGGRMVSDMGVGERVGAERIKGGEAGMAEDIG
jgi:hypothetical protein